MICKRKDSAFSRVKFLVLTIVLLFTVSALGEGLFPSMNQMFGTSMPSIGVALSRNADETGENTEGKYEVYNSFSYDDYTVFGAYLAGVGAGLQSTDVTESAIMVDLAVSGASMRFIFDWGAQTAKTIYPSGTRPETEKASVEAKPSILPPVGGTMPSAQFAVGREPNVENADENGITQVWTSFTDEDYSSFSIYLAQVGATLRKSHAEAGILTAEIGLNGSCFSLTYDWHTKTASVFYPKGTSPEREKWNTLKGTGSILPKMDTIGKNLPSISQAILRVPDSTETLADGSQKETYNSFIEEDYTALSKYLQTVGCVVDDYHVDEGGVMVINLSNLTGSFTFTYDSLRHIGTAVYPMGSRVEDAWVAPTATPEPTATATPVPSQIYSQSECWKIAKQYFENLRWHNPSSVTIHEYSATYDTNDNTYTFYIDYSAQVVAGGYKRSYYFIGVSAVTGQITIAFGGD